MEQIRTGHKREAWATGNMVSGRYSGFLCVDVDTKPARPGYDVTFRQVSGGKSISTYLPPPPS